MSLSKMKNVLGELPDGTHEHEGTVIVPLKKADDSLNAGFELRAVRSRLQPLVDAGWTVRQGAQDFRTGAVREIVCVAPVEMIDTATLDLRHRLRLEAGVERMPIRESLPRREGYIGAPQRVIVGYKEDFLDRLHVVDNVVHFNSEDLSGHDAQRLQQLVNRLGSKGWRGSTSRKHGSAAFTGTIQPPPGKGQQIPKARVEDEAYR